MGWRHDQKERLRIELAILESKWPGWNVNDTGSQMYLSRQMKTNHNKAYRVKILVTAEYPDEEPELHIVRPMPKVKAFTHEDHTLSRNSNGQCICGYANWEPNDTLLQATLRLREWLVAYDSSRNVTWLELLLGVKTKKSISSILD